MPAISLHAKHPLLDRKQIGKAKKIHCTPSCIYEPEVQALHECRPESELGLGNTGVVAPMTSPQVMVIPCRLLILFLAQSAFLSRLRFWLEVGGWIPTKRLSLGAGIIVGHHTDGPASDIVSEARAQASHSFGQF
jgi:hypothetical protein